MAFFPFMIQMQDKLCVIGGGGKVAYRKVSMMLSFGARVTVIAPKICDELQKIESKQGALLLVQRPFEDGDIEGADVVIMATNDSEVNSHIAAICKDKRILVNVVDVKKDCGFYFPAIIKQDDVVVSVSTGDEKVLISRYRRQMELYRDALEKMTGKKVVKCLLYSFSLSETIEC